MQIAEAIECPVEINIFYRTEERIASILKYLEQLKQLHNITTEILGVNPDAKIPGLEGPRADCCSNGILSSDVVLVPLEDGDRCEALVRMGKTVIVVDLNPMSRSAKMASITIVDEITRVTSNMIDMLEQDNPPEIDVNFVNAANLQQSVNVIAARYM